MIYSASQAAKAVGRSTATITRAIDKGRISAVKDENGAWQIDASELHRVFAPANPESPSMQSDAKANANSVEGAEVATLREQLADAERRAAVAATLADEVMDLRRRLDAESEERRRLTAVLMAPPSAPPALPAAPHPRRWWPWARG